MFPRLPRLLRLALLVLCLLLSVLFMLRAGGDHPDHSHPGLLHVRHLPPTAVQGRILSAIRQPQNASQKLIVPKVYRVNKTAASAASASAGTKTMLEGSIVNPHPFTYLINPRNACQTAHEGHVKLLVYIHSAPANFKKRMSIRQTWGERSVLQLYQATAVFIMGTVPDASLMDLMQLESETYGDIVQEDFMDTYRNLTYKAIAGLKWTASFCSKVTYILKTDDDILVNLPRVMRYIRTVVEPKYGNQRLILCNQWVRMKIIRDPKSKWYVPESDLKGDYFSPYCSGSAFLLSGDMARLLYEASLRTPFFWVDDFYITGTLVRNLGIEHKSLNKAYSLNPGVGEGKFANDTKHELFFFHLHKLRTMYYMWRNMSAAIAPTPVVRTVNLTHSGSVLPVARAG